MGYTWLLLLALMLFGDQFEGTIGGQRQFWARLLVEQLFRAKKDPASALDDAGVWNPESNAYEYVEKV